MNQTLSQLEIIKTSSPLPTPIRGIYFLIDGIEIVYVGQADFADMYPTKQPEGDQR